MILVVSLPTHTWPRWRSSGGAAIYSTDYDFKRFPGIEHVNPIA